MSITTAHDPIADLEAAARALTEGHDPAEVAVRLQGIAERLRAQEAERLDGPYIAEACVVRCGACHRKVADVDMEYHEHLTDCEGDT
jgi:hypothetical protein